MIALMLMVPLVIALALVLVLPQGISKFIAMAGALAGLALLPFIGSGTYSVPWFSSAGLAFGLVTSVSQINLLLLAMVLGIAPLILLYSFGFMDTHSQQRRFYSEMLAFEAAMVLFAMSGSFITMFIAWEFLSLTSYLLIGFWNEKESANRAARKAITIVFIGDIAILAAIAVMTGAFGTLTFSGVIAALPGNSAAALVVAVLLGIAVLTKSAQFPFQEWLTDAMEGPAPVSAFLHSTTMVKAGVFLVMVLLPIFSSAGILPVISALSLITVAVATMNALKEMHVKRVIAYSTIQELGLMLFAVASGAVLAGVFLFFAQSFYKALLFFSSGAMMKATGEEDIRRISGLRRNNALYIATLFGVLSLAGFVPFDGFFAGSALGSAFSTNLVYYVVLNVFGILTSFYMFRWLFFTSRKEASAGTAVGFEMLPRSMVAGAIVLGIAALLASFAFPYFRYLFEMPYPVYSALGTSTADELVVLALAFAGAVASYAAFRKGLALRSRAATAIIYSKALFNGLYDISAAFILGIAAGAATFEHWLDVGFRGIGMSVYYSSGFIRRLSYGEINLYVLTLSVATMAMIALVYFVR